MNIYSTVFYHTALRVVNVFSSVNLYNILYLMSIAYIQIHIQKTLRVYLKIKHGAFLFYCNKLNTNVMLSLYLDSSCYSQYSGSRGYSYDSGYGIGGIGCRGNGDLTGYSTEESAYLIILIVSGR